MNTPESPQDKLAALLTKAGPRSAPPARIEAEVRAAVHAEWQHLLHSRKLKQQQRWLSAAAVFMGALSIGWLARNMSINTPVTNAPALLASITYSQGRTTLNDSTLTTQTQLHAGDHLHTDSNSALRIELQSGISLRIAAGSDVKLNAADELQLQQGSIYVDSNDNRAPLNVHTTYGDISHIGTRYFIAADTQAVQVAVRTGQVAIRTNQQQTTVNALEQVQVGPVQQIQRSVLQLDDPRWQWAQTLATPFVLENRSLSEFLQWVERETGYEVRYASNEVSKAAARTVLHGQQTSLPPLQALQVVAASTDFRITTQDQQLVIEQR